MPSIRSGGHSSGGSRSFSSGHFGGGFRGFSSGHSSTGSRSFSSGHSRSSSSRSSSGYRPSFNWRPHTTVVFGRSVYFGAGRSAALSLLGVLLSIGVFICVIFGFNWHSAETDYSEFVDGFHYYQQMAQYAAENPEYQVIGRVSEIEPHGATGIYCVYYSFDSYLNEGFSFCSYDRSTAEALLNNRDIVLAIDDRNDNITSDTDSVPLDFKDAVLAEDPDYQDFKAKRDQWRLFGALAIGGTVLVGGVALLVMLTAKKATKEQLAADGKTDASQTSTTPNGSWRCEYCNSLNDTSKTECDGCGAGRQK